MMKKILFVLTVLFFLAGICLADSITLDSGEVLSVPTAATISEWEITKINAANKIMIVKYRWRDASGDVINLGNGRTGWNYWTCRNISEGDNALCTDVDIPWDCCTGVGIGTCPEVIDSCFSDVFGFLIRQQDVDTSIGLGLRTLIWNRMKVDILTGANDGDFD